MTSTLTHVLLLTGVRWLFAHPVLSVRPQPLPSATSDFPGEREASVIRVEHQAVFTNNRMNCVFYCNFFFNHNFNAINILETEIQVSRGLSNCGTRTVVTGTHP